MTLIEERQRAETATSEATSAPVTSPDVVVNSADHKRLGLIWMAASVVFLLFGIVVGEVLQIALAAPNNNVVGDHYGELFSLHAAATGILFLAPLWIGLGTYVLPLQIGAPRLALPRAHTLATWLFVFGGGLFLVSYLVATPTQGGVSLSQPLAAGATSHLERVAASMWVSGLFLATLGMVIASAGLLSTLVKLRTPGMTMPRVPLFSWGVATSSAVTLITTPAFLAGLILLYIDQHYGGKFFSPAANPIAATVWQHTVWMFGRPDIYLLLLPGLGAAGDIFATHLHHPLASLDVARGAVGAFGVLTLTIWTASSPATRAVLLPTPTWPTALLAAPVGVLVLILLDTGRRGRPRFHLSLAWAGAGFALLGAGAVAAFVAAISSVDQGTAWTTGNIHLVVFGAPTLLALGAVYHWSPKLFGRSLNQVVGGLALVVTFGGFALTGIAGYVAGYQHVAWQTLTDPHLLKGTPKALNALMAAGGILVTLGIVIVALDAVRALVAGGAPAADDPYEGLTLEWATASPPPPYNFEAVPEVRSAQPLADLRAAAAGEA